MSDTTTVDLSDPVTFEGGVPHGFFDQLRRSSPVYWNPTTSGAPAGGFWALTRHADVSAVSRDTATFTSTEGMHYPTNPAEIPGMRDNVMFNDPPRHTRIRALASRGFSPRVVARFEDWVRERVRLILDSLPADEAFDAVPLIAAELPAQVIASVMGAPEEDRHRIVRWASDIFAREQPGGFERAQAALGQVFAYADELREVKRRNPAADMITELADTEHDGVPITDNEYRQFVMSLLIAGFETTHTLIGQSLRLMIEDPEIDEQVRTAVATVGSQRPVEEFLRYVTPAMQMARVARVDTVVGGTTIKAGEMAVMWYVAANRDPEVFPDPHRFDVSRRLAAHTSFGAGGAHFCIGNHLARLEGRVLLDEIVQRDLRFRPAGTPKRGHTVFINALVELPVALA
ncbi:hypothetical protein BL253_34430 [Pseudofrankia asymbiotica]|uniref:Cytochrome n=1 Tax=Pseudofrankia asymbiotica TaxID=1834516 RepID=A0A1V2I0P4_9ACTN|nr:hypothetical protein BL253_34430 [Pseudofrankia asymbiotica]